MSVEYKVNQEGALKFYNVNETFYDNDKKNIEDIKHIKEEGIKKSIKTEKIPDSLQKVIDNIVDLFIKKNSAYRDKSHWASAFLKNSLVTKGNLNCLEWALTQCNKQDEATYDLIFSAKDLDLFEKKGGIDMVVERLSDGIVYRIIVLALLKEFSIKDLVENNINK